MKFSIKPTDPGKLETDVLIVTPKDLYKVVKKDHPLSTLISEAFEKEQFEDKLGNFLFLSTKGYIGSYKLLIAGIGENTFDYSELLNFTAKICRKVSEIKTAKVAFVVPEIMLKKFMVGEAVSGIIEAFSLSSYKLLKYKSEEEQKKFRSIEEVILCLAARSLGGIDESIKKGEVFSQAAIFARDLVNEPSNTTTPSYLAKVAEEIAKKNPSRINVKIYSREDALKMGMNAYLSVAKGSDEEPKFIRLSYKPKSPKKKVVLVGKGVTFDTGGLSLKGAEHMETMKLDMAGAATVLAVFSALSGYSCDFEVVGLIAACENMPSGKALKPGDILRAMNGKTIEVLNTDAEGRLTLADALSYAVINEKPDVSIDLATLTGACMVALGQDIAGLWGNDEKLLEKIDSCAKNTGEQLWKMPIHKDYKELIKSNIADLKNIQTGRYGGAITAALFLSEFVGQTPWVHLDIAGPAFAEQENSMTPKGGTGYGVRLILDFLTS